MATLDLPGVAPEGRFFPSTYQFEADSTDIAILERARQRMDQILDRLWQQRQPDLPYTSPDQALIMASIVERKRAAPTSVAKSPASSSGAC
jgi:UPF0755 protein